MTCLLNVFFCFSVSLKCSYWENVLLSENQRLSVAKNPHRTYRHKRLKTYIIFNRLLNLSEKVKLMFADGVIRGSAEQ